MFVSTGTQGGGQEATIINSLSTLAHHGIVYVPLGYKPAFAQLGNLSEVHGGASPLPALFFVDVCLMAVRVCVSRIALGCGCICSRRWESPAQCPRARDRQDPWSIVLRDRFQAQVLKESSDHGFELIMYIPYLYHTFVKSAGANGL